jgi:hypothetical protein
MVADLIQQVSDLILRRREAPSRRMNGTGGGYMVRDAASRLLTMRG